MMNTDYHVFQMDGRMRPVEAMTVLGRRSVEPGSTRIRGAPIQIADTQVNA